MLGGGCAGEGDKIGIRPFPRWPSARIGGDGRFEASPTSEIARLKAQSGDGYRKISDRIGLAYRKCTEALDAANASNRRLAPPPIAYLAEQCAASGNCQLIDLAGQVFGRQRHFDCAIVLFERALDAAPWVKDNRKIFFMPAWLESFLGAHASAEALAIVERWLDSHPNLSPDIRRKLLVPLHGLRRTVRIRAGR